MFGKDEGGKDEYILDPLPGAHGPQDVVERQNEAMLLHNRR